MKFLNFQNKRWVIAGKILHNYVHNPDDLKEIWKCDMVIKDKTHYWLLDKIIDVEFE